MASYDRVEARDYSRQHLGNNYYYWDHESVEDKRAEQETRNEKLFEAAVAGQVNRVQYLLAQGADVDYARREYGKDHRWDVAVGDELCSCSACTTVGDGESTPVLLAALDSRKTTSSHVAAVTKALIAAGVDVNIPRRAQYRVVDSLDHSLDGRLYIADSNTALHIALKVANRDAVDALLSAGANIRAKNERGETPLHTAAAADGDQSDLTMTLLQAGAVLDAKDYDLEQPLHLAVLCGNSRVVKVLLEAGAAPNARGSNQETPLHKAALRANWNIAEVLYATRALPEAFSGNATTLPMRPYASCNLRSETGETPMMIAVAVCSHTSPDLLRFANLLRRHGARDVDELLAQYDIANRIREFRVLHHLQPGWLRSGGYSV